VDTGPSLDGVGAFDEVHAGVGELRKCRLRFCRVIAEGRHDGAHAIRHDVALLREGRILLENVLEQVFDAGLDAMARRLTRDDDCIRLQERLDEVRVALSDGTLTVPPGQHLGAQDGVVLGQRIAALDLAVGLSSTHKGVEHLGLLEDAQQSVSGTTENAVEGPSEQRVLALLLQLLAIMFDLLAEPAVVSIAKP